MGTRRSGEASPRSSGGERQPGSGAICWNRAPKWILTKDGYEATVGVSGTERFTVVLQRSARGFWYSSFGERRDRGEERIVEGPFASLTRAKAHAVPR